MTQYDNDDLFEADDIIKNIKPVQNGKLRYLNFGYIGFPYSI